MNDDRRQGRGTGAAPEQAFPDLPRRSLFKGVLAAGVAAYPLARGAEAAASPLRRGAEAAAGAPLDPPRPASYPFYGFHQAGIDRPGPKVAQPVANFASFDVTVANRKELTDLFRTLTDRARFLTSGGKLAPAGPGGSPLDDRLLGETVVPDGLTVTVAVGASLFDGRYGLGSRKPVQLKTMEAFEHDALNPGEIHGDVLIQTCANHRDVLVHAFLDITSHTAGALKPRWRVEGFIPPPRPSGTPRDMLGFKDGIANPDTNDAQQMNQEVWVQPGGKEPAWTAGGTYQVIRIVRFFVPEWNKVPVDQQELIIGRRKVTGAPLYGTDQNQDPVYNNDPQGVVTPLDAHIRLANPQTPETAATSAILRRSYQYDRTPDPSGDVNIGHAFCCYQQELDTYIAMQTRLEREPLVKYISPKGGGYFFTLPGVQNSQDYYARGLLA